MEIRVRYFASLVERAGQTSETVAIEPDTDVQELWRLLVQRHPALGQVGYRPLVACDRSYAEWTSRLDGVGEVAFLPPVSGG